MKAPASQKPGTPANHNQKNDSFFGKEGNGPSHGTAQPKQHFFRGNSQAIQTKPEVNAAGNLTGNYSFDPGHDGLGRSFFLKVKKAVSDGTLSDDEIGALRKDAIDRNGTVIQAELLLMAAMRNPPNVTLMQSYRHGSLIIPMSQIRKADEDYLTDFGRDSLPLDIIALEGQKILANLGLIGKTPDDAQNELDGDANDHILEYAGKQFDTQANRLIVTAMSKPEVSLVEILQAMLNAASDSTPGDRVMAGLVYYVARKANHPMTSSILSGALKVDGLIPSVYRRIAGGGSASYQTMSTDVLKADTIYVPTSLDIFNLDDRALIIHELTHAAEDFAATGPKSKDSLNVEARAYKAQGKYMMDEILPQPVAQRDFDLRSAASYANSSQLFYWSMVGAAKDDVSKYESVLVDINTHRPMSMGAPAVKADLGLSLAVIDSNIRRELLNYRDAHGEKIYPGGPANFDGPQGQYFHL
jgi:hypothetical protein